MSDGIGRGKTRETNPTVELQVEIRDTDPGALYLTSVLWGPEPRRLTRPGNEEFYDKIMAGVEFSRRQSGK